MFNLHSLSAIRAMIGLSPYHGFHHRPVEIVSARSLQGASQRSRGATPREEPTIPSTIIAALPAWLRRR
jgi:hypothetical protein